MAAVPQYFIYLEMQLLSRLSYSFLYLITKEVNIPNHHFALNMEFVPCNLTPIHDGGLKILLNETKMKLNSLVLKHLINKLLQRHV